MKLSRASDLWGSCQPWELCTMAIYHSVCQIMVYCVLRTPIVLNQYHPSQALTRREWPDCSVHLCQHSAVCASRRPCNIPTYPSARSQPSLCARTQASRPSSCTTHAFSYIFALCEGHVSLRNQSRYLPAEGHIRRGQGIWGSNGRTQQANVFQRDSHNRHEIVQYHPSAYNIFLPIECSNKRPSANECLLRPEGHPASTPPASPCRRSTPPPSDTWSPAHRPHRSWHHKRPCSLLA